MKIGKLPENVLKRSVLRQLNQMHEEVANSAGVGVDCAILMCQDKMFMSCVQEGVLGMDPQADDTDVSTTTISRLIQKCANNLAAGKAKIVAIMIAFILPESVEETWIKVIMQEARAQSDKLSVEIAGGQTRVSKAVLQPVAVITGYGIPVKPVKEMHVAAGQDLVISKWIGLEGTAVLAKKNRERLLSRYPAHLVEEAAGFERYLSIIPEAATAVKSDVCVMHDISEGGIWGALWELAERIGVGLTVDLKKIPLRQETVEICEFCETNPYELMSGGSLLMITEDGCGLVTVLEAQGIPAAVIGKITDSNDRIILNDDEVRYLDRPKQDTLYIEKE